MNKTLTPAQSKELLKTLQTRFEKNMHRHNNVQWKNIQTKLESNPQKLWSLEQMEQSGGEPDVIAHDNKTDEYVFADCSAQTPKGRTNACYDREALDARKEHKPKENAIDLAEEMGIKMLTEEEYRHLQTLGEFDTKTSSWLKTPEAIRKLGGAIFGDRRYDHVFIYHNGAQSYYAIRGFRGLLRV